MSNLTKIRLYIDTLSHLKAKQIYYRLFYLARDRLFTDLRKKQTILLRRYASVSYGFLRWRGFVAAAQSYWERNRFVFLNQEHTFEGAIDWNFDGYGKLWRYNLSYFDFLSQSDMDVKTATALMHDFIDRSETATSGMMPYPISLRVMNWIKFISIHKIKDQKIISHLRFQLEVLSKHLEYHILGNHLLENGFALLWGGYFFKDKRLLDVGRKIVKEELDEQILADGAHFELSPMYHQIILHRLLDVISLYTLNEGLEDESYITLLRQKASLMCGWLEAITMQDGSIPHLNDSSFDIAPSTLTLLEYARSLGLKRAVANLGECGYRKFQNDWYEAVVDVGEIGPEYIPGHAHADTLSFVLHIDQKPFLVDTGVSTYQNDRIRAYERSTRAHNTIEVQGRSQSEMWGGFRVAKRAKIVSLQETQDSVEAAHDGYKKIGVLHRRKWRFGHDSITIEDVCEGGEGKRLVSCLHFHPDINVRIENDTVVTPYATIRIDGALKLTLSEYNYALGFNRVKPAALVEAIVQPQSKMEIRRK